MDFWRPWQQRKRNPATSILLSVPELHGRRTFHLLVISPSRSTIRVDICELVIVGLASMSGVRSFQVCGAWLAEGSGRLGAEDCRSSLCKGMVACGVW